MTCGFMQTLIGKFRVMAMCRVFQMSRSGFYVWQRRQSASWLIYHSD